VLTTRPVDFAFWTTFRAAYGHVTATLSDAYAKELKGLEQQYLKQPQHASLQRPAWLARAAWPFGLSSL
jgi:hypothetical protein